MQSLDEFRPSTVCRKHFEREYQGVTLKAARVAPVVAAEEALMAASRKTGLDAFIERKDAQDLLAMALGDANLLFPCTLRAQQAQGQVTLVAEPFLTARSLSSGEIAAWVEGLASYCMQQAREERTRALKNDRRLPGLKVGEKLARMQQDGALRQR